MDADIEEFVLDDMTDCICQLRTTGVHSGLNYVTSNFQPDAAPLDFTYLSREKKIYLRDCNRHTRDIFKNKCSTVFLH